MLATLNIEIFSEMFPEIPEFYISAKVGPQNIFKITILIISKVRRRFPEDKYCISLSLFNIKSIQLRYLITDLKKF